MVKLNVLDTVDCTRKYKGFMYSDLDLAAKSDKEPVENLCNRHKADPKAKSTKAAKARDEVQPSHLAQPLKL